MNDFRKSLKTWQAIDKLVERIKIEIAHKRSYEEEIIRLEKNIEHKKQQLECKLSEAFWPDKVEEIMEELWLEEKEDEISL